MTDDLFEPQTMCISDVVVNDADKPADMKSWLLEQSGDILIQLRIYDLTTSNKKLEKNVFNLEEKLNYYIETKNIDDCSCSIYKSYYGVSKDSQMNYFDISVCGSFKNNIEAFLDICAYFMSIGSLYTRIFNHAKLVTKCSYTVTIAKRTEPVWPFDEKNDAANDWISFVDEGVYLFQWKYAIEEQEDKRLYDKGPIYVHKIKDVLKKYFPEIEESLFNRIVLWKQRASKNKKRFCCMISDNIFKKYPNLSLEQKEQIRDGCLFKNGYYTPSMIYIQ